MRNLLPILLLTFSSLSFAQTIETGSVRGVVVDASTQTPIPFAIVSVHGTKLAATTDSLGEFRFPDVYPGTYTVIAKCTGFKVDTLANVVVTLKEVTLLHIELTYPPPCDWNVVTFMPFNKKRGWIVGSVQGALVTGSLIGLHQLWYKQYPRESFHTFNDAAEWNQMDKLGHFQSSYSIAQISTSLWDLSHMNHKRATWIGGLTSFGYLTAIEIMDGYSTGWGFSTSDMIANTAGSALFISQELLWGNQKMMPKFGFSPSSYAEMRPDLLGSNFTEQMLKDYNGQTYWLSVNVASFLQSETKFPRWLNVAVGYGANGMTGGHENPVMYNSSGNQITIQRYRQYYLSLDIDLRRIPTRSRFLRILFNTLNFIKIPAPAIEVNKFGVRGYVLKF